MTLNNLAHKADQTIRHNSPAILTALGVSGTLATAYLVGKASFVAGRVVHDMEHEREHTTREKVDAVWRLYIPSAVTGCLTVTCIIMGHRAGAKRTAAAVSLVTITERAFDEYKDKVVEKIGEKKEKDIRDEIAQERANANPPTVIIGGAGTVMCCELHTMRYFLSDIEKIRKTENKINMKILRENEATLDDFYHEVGLETTSHSGYSGWDMGRPLELSFTTVMSPDEKPCIAFEYNYVKAL